MQEDCTAITNIKLYREGNKSKILVQLYLYQEKLDKSCEFQRNGYLIIDIQLESLVNFQDCSGD